MADGLGRAADRRRRRAHSWNKMQCESVLGAYSYIEESSSDLISWIDESARDSSACISRGLQLDDLVPDGPNRLVRAGLVWPTDRSQ